jgi:hypothetical protein
MPNYHGMSEVKCLMPDVSCFVICRAFDINILSLKREGANLTDDAFLRNLELGALFTGDDMPIKLRQHFEHLVANGTLTGVESLNTRVG